MLRELMFAKPVFRCFLLAKILRRGLSYHLLFSAILGSILKKQESARIPLIFCQDQHILSELQKSIVCFLAAFKDNESFSCKILPDKKITYKRKLESSAQENMRLFQVTTRKGPIANFAKSRTFTAAFRLTKVTFSIAGEVPR